MMELVAPDGITNGGQPSSPFDPSSDIPHQTIERKDEGSEVIQPGEGIPSDNTPTLGSEVGVGCRRRVISSIDLLKQCWTQMDDTGTQLWGLHIRASAVTLFVGQTSARKTVLLHNLAYHLASGATFFGLTPPRPLKVLYVDFESYAEILAEHLSAIGTVAGWDFYKNEEERTVRGQLLLSQLKEEIRTGRYDVVIVDPLMEAFPVDDENDNAMADIQMRAFRGLARETGAALVLVHNSGHRGSNTGCDEKFLLRGATCRVDRADVVINYTSTGKNTRQLNVVKSRGKNLHEVISVRFLGELGYEVSGCSVTSETLLSKLQIDTLTIVKSEAEEGRPEVERKTFMEKLQIEKGSAREQTLDRALSKNVLTEALVKPRKGTYAVPPVPGGEESKAA